jgi:hypothetical protein
MKTFERVEVQIHIFLTSELVDLFSWYIIKQGLISY